MIDRCGMKGKEGREGRQGKERKGRKERKGKKVRNIYIYIWIYPHSKHLTSDIKAYGIGFIHSYGCM